MKKEYIKPAVECYNIGCETIVALSTQEGVEITDGNKDGFEQYSREDNTPSAPNLWEQGW